MIRFVVVVVVVIASADLLLFVAAAVAHAICCCLYQFVVVTAIVVAAAADYIVPCHGIHYNQVTLDLSCKMPRYQINLIPLLSGNPCSTSISV